MSRLWEELIDITHPLPHRENACKYLSSLLGRASFISFEYALLYSDPFTLLVVYQVPLGMLPNVI